MVDVDVVISINERWEKKVSLMMNVQRRFLILSRNMISALQMISFALNLVGTEIMVNI